MRQRRPRRTTTWRSLLQQLQELNYKPATRKG